MTDQPNDYHDWIAVATQRSGDADHLSFLENTVGPIYMAGYVIECSLKAYLQRMGKAFPTSGSAGHDLRRLWKAAGFTLGDLPDHNGHATYFITGWSTDLRYTTTLPGEYSSDDLVKAAQQVSAYIRSRTRTRT
jgi:hypothetical protein